MSTTTFNLANDINGSLADADAVTIGIVRTDTSAVVVAPGTAVTHTGTGTYTYTVTDPAYGLTYVATWAVTIQGETYTVAQTKAGTAMPGTTYLALAAAKVLRGTLPPMRHWDATADDARAAALVQASSDIDQAQRYQGRKFKHDQVQQFPRLAYGGNGFPGYGPLGWGYDGNCGGGSPRTVWDWDEVNKVAVVPADVLAACLWQADWILGDHVARLDEQHAGVKSQQAAGVGESYGPSEGLATGLCRRAWQLVWKYRLVSGELE